MPVNPRIPRRLAVAVAQTRAGRAGATAIALVGALLLLDLIGFIATVYFGPELLAAARAAGLAGFLPQ